jgi:hypothetical protein
MGIGSDGRIAPRTPLEYKIRFQNTENDIAYRVVIVDTLSQDLDLSTFEELGFSHPYTLSLSGRGRPVLRFAFPNINLPDSLSNPELSQGYVRFRISPKENTPLGTRIRNKAEIYFDFNEPIVTNRTINTLYVPTVTSGIVDSVVVLSSQTLKSGFPLVSLVPNPSQGRFELRSDSPVSFHIFSVEGRSLKRSSNSSRHHLIDIHSLGKGPYFKAMKNEKGQRQIQRVVVQ